MGKYCRVACLILFFGTILFGCIYPLTIWMLAHLFFPYQAEGSPILSQDAVVGFEMIGQHFSSSKYFSSRPEVGMQEVSGGSNLSWSSEALRKKVAERKKLLRKEVSHIAPIPSDLLMESASGFDPHISLKAALFQAEKVSHARNISEQDLFDLILESMDTHLFGLFPDRVNVLLLNRRLDERYTH